MSSQQPRLRMFAGPNGSGKSTIREGILPEHLIGVDVNADQIQLEISSTNSLNLTQFHIRCDAPWFSEERSLDLLYDAITLSNRAYVWDNSGAPSEQFLVAEFADGQLVRAAPEVPLWFYESVIQKIPADTTE